MTPSDWHLPERLTRSSRRKTTLTVGSGSSMPLEVSSRRATLSVRSHFFAIVFRIESHLPVFRTLQERRGSEWLRTSSISCEAGLVLCKTRDAFPVSSKSKARRRTLSRTTSDSVSLAALSLSRAGLIIRVPSRHAGGSCVITILKRPEFYKAGGQDGRDRLGYNHACECRESTMEDVAKVQSRKAHSKWAEANL